MPLTSYFGSVYSLGMEKVKVYVGTTTDHLEVIQNYSDNTCKYVCYSNYMKKTVLAKGTFYPSGPAMTSHYVLYVSEDELLKLVQVLSRIKSSELPSYEIISETRKNGNGKRVRLVLKTNQFGLALLRQTEEITDDGPVIVPEDDPDPVESLPVTSTITWKDGYENFVFSAKDDIQGIVKKLRQYYAKVPAYQKEQTPPPPRKRKPPSTSRVNKKNKKIDSGDEEEEDDFADVMPAVSFLLEAMKESNMGALECVLHFSEALEVGCLEYYDTNVLNKLSKKYGNGDGRIDYVRLLKVIGESEILRLRDIVFSNM